eukprot:TRINITY_DN26319_c0_g1_i1.p1 TRINITY_DN26319_c0_g1~~TRINITY_DN26319_c0_g1_i1.p1  ORF type:complete len:424 (-),score=53.52 TRINITY_DN26319_c0_g1_i1:285-1556(-)
MLFGRVAAVIAWILGAVAIVLSATDIGHREELTALGLFYIFFLWVGNTLLSLYETPLKVLPDGTVAALEFSKPSEMIVYFRYLYILPWLFLFGDGAVALITVGVGQHTDISPLWMLFLLLVGMCANIMAMGVRYEFGRLGLQHPFEDSPKDVAVCFGLPRGFENPLWTTWVAAGLFLVSLVGSILVIVFYGFDIAVSSRWFVGLICGLFHMLTFLAICGYNTVMKLNTATCFGMIYFFGAMIAMLITYTSTMNARDVDASWPILLQATAFFGHLLALVGRKISLVMRSSIDAANLGVAASPVTIVQPAPTPTWPQDSLVVGMPVGQAVGGSMPPIGSQPQPAVVGASADAPASLERDITEASLKAVLAEAHLEMHADAAKRWCDTQGAVAFKELSDNMDDFAATLKLKPLEVKRLQNALASRI